MALKQSDVLARVDQAKEIEFHFDYRHSSVTPHAPYSGSKHLFKALKRSVREDNILSIHNQESEEENKLFRYKKGEFLAFYEQMGMDVSEFKAQARNSLQSYLPYIPVSNKLILVHNTYTSLKDWILWNVWGGKCIRFRPKRTCTSRDVFLELKTFCGVDSELCWERIV